MLPWRDICLTHILHVLVGIRESDSDGEMTGERKTYKELKMWGKGVKKPSIRRCLLICVSSSGETSFLSSLTRLTDTGMLVDCGPCKAALQYAVCQRWLAWLGQHHRQPQTQQGRGGLMPLETRQDSLHPPPTPFSSSFPHLSAHLASHHSWSWCQHVTWIGRDADIFVKWWPDLPGHDT